MAKELALSTMSYFTAAEAAGLLGISKQTLIRYEKQGIFPPAHRNAVNGWREYTQDRVRNLRRILGRESE